jgi:hypothetical protein
MVEMHQKTANIASGCVTFLDVHLAQKALTGPFFYGTLTLPTNHNLQDTPIHGPNRRLIEHLPGRRLG